MKKELSNKLTFWGAILFLSGAILISGGSSIGTGALFMMIGGMIGILTLFHNDRE